MKVFEQYHTCNIIVPKFGMAETKGGLSLRRFQIKIYALKT
jgi:hypothetical protein